RVEQGALGVAQVDLLVAGAEQETAVLQRLDDWRGQRIAAAGDAGDGGVGVVIGVGCELFERLLEARWGTLLGPLLRTLLRTLLGTLLRTLLRTLLGTLGARGECAGQQQAERHHDRSTAFVTGTHVGSPDVAEAAVNRRLPCSSV